MAYEWNKGDNQKVGDGALSAGVHADLSTQWTAIRVSHDSWKLQNHQTYDDQLRFLSPQLEDAQPDKNYRLVGGMLSCEFVIQEIGATGTYRCRLL